MNIDNIIKYAYARFKKGNNAKPHKACLSEEDMVCFLENKLVDRDRTRVLNHLVSCKECAQTIKENYALRNVLEDDAIPDPPVYLAERAKKLFNTVIEGNVLDIVLKLKDRIIDIVSTTGQILQSYQQSSLSPALAFRSDKKQNESNDVRISKQFEDASVNVEIEKQKANLLNISIHITDPKSKERIEGIRVNLVKKDRELESLLSERGKVKFEKIKPDAYKIALMSEGKEIGVINLNMHPE